jgi:hypothetical protein
MVMTAPESPPRAPRLHPVGIALRLAALIIAVLLLNLAVDAIGHRLPPASILSGPGMQRAILIAAAVYVVALAVPFVPGVEIGLLLLGIFGAPVAPLVWGATIAGLAIAFAAGRLIPVDTIPGIGRRLGLARPADLVGAPSRDARTADRTCVRPTSPFGRFLVRRRYLALAVLLNLPGNVVLGGGGGIALMAGASRLYPPLAFLACVVLATAPVPLAVLLLGRSPFD